MQDDVDEYEQELLALVRQANEGDIDQQDFQRRAMELTAAILLLLFLRGGRLSLSELQAHFGARGVVQQAERQAQLSTESLAQDIYQGRYRQPEGDAQLVRRVGLWATTALGVYSIGQLYRQDDPFLAWEVGPTEHCSDCQRLNGQVHTASEWRIAGWQPQSQRLECNGYRCQCRLRETDGPSRGSF